MVYEEPELKDGLIRLYRIGLLPKECRLSRIIPLSPEFANLDWKDQMAAERGINAAFGRWFTQSREIANWYAGENLGCPLYFVDVPEKEASEWIVTKNPDARRFSADPKNEYFIPETVANTAQVMPNYTPLASPVAPLSKEVPLKRAIVL